VRSGERTLTGSPRDHRRPTTGPPAGAPRRLEDVTDEGGDTTEAHVRSPLAPGTKVDVRNRYQGTWVRGFEIAEVTEEGYRIRRLSDGTILVDLFPRDDVRRERRRQGFWWH